jgi:hypothetical protein
MTIVKSSKLAAALSLLLMTATLSPAFAKDEEGALDKSVQGGLMVTRVGGVGAGVVVGAPVAVVRETISSYIGMTGAVADKVGGKAGGKDNGLATAVVSLVTVPAALVVGGAKGLYYGSKNGMMHGFNQPFSPSSFSISKDIEKE